jgi:hypothetical protein
LKKASMLLLCVIALLAILVVVDVPYTNRQAKMDSSSNKNVSSNFTSIAPSSQETQTITATASQQDSDLYIVKEYKGHIGVFREGDKLPFKEINKDISIFPEEDQKLLRDGILARGTAELTLVIEDYEG